MREKNSMNTKDENIDMFKIVKLSEGTRHSGKPIYESIHTRSTQCEFIVKASKVVGLRERGWGQREQRITVTTLTTVGSNGDAHYPHYENDFNGCTCVKMHQITL